VIQKKSTTGPKQNADLAIRIEVLDWLHNEGQENQSKTARHFKDIYPNINFSQPLISSWVSGEAKWRERAAAENAKSKRVRSTTYPEVEEMLGLWVVKAIHDGLLLTGPVLRQKWTEFANRVGVPENERPKLSEGWLTRFKQRHGLKEHKRHGEAGSTDQLSVDEERNRVQLLIKNSCYAPKDIFNMDETGLMWSWVQILIDCTYNLHKIY
jgi:hypothetical protein